jgi:CRP/FNR family transcriptional regulator, nitrogen fixation regulation protein
MLPQPTIRTEPSHPSVASRFTSSRVAPHSATAREGFGRRSLLAETLQLMGAAVSFTRNSEIFGESELADYVYIILSGSVRTYKILADGRRQIGDFYRSGEIFGLEFANAHTCSAEAVVDSKVIVVKRSALNALAERNPSIGRELRAITGRELQRAHNHMLLLVKSAQERVASFLLEMAERACAEKVLELPMSRQDIADYLGLAIETVSRMLTDLESAAAIEVATSRRIFLRNRSMLHRLNS